MASESVGGQPAHRSPVRIAFDSQRRLVVSDYNQQMILILSPATLATVGGFRVVGRPLGVACWKDRILVGNETRGRVEVCDASGKRLYDLGDAATTISQPTDIAVDTTRSLVFVVDGREKAVKVFSTSGPLVRTIGGPGPVLDPLLAPTGIALDTAHQRVFVSDYGSPAQYIAARVQMYDYSGNHVGAISGKQGMLGERFSRPQGLAVDTAGRLFLVESLYGQILVFDVATGIQLKTIGDFGSNPGQLRLPLDIVMDDATKDLFVTNNRLGRIEVFRGGGLLP